MTAESALVESAAGVSACAKLANAVNSNSTKSVLNFVNKRVIVFTKEIYVYSTENVAFTFPLPRICWRRFLFTLSIRARRVKFQEFLS